MQVRARIAEIEEGLTPTERRLSAALMADYPFAGLDTIQSFADHAHTSPPTISRFVTKLGFNGYQDFQRALIEEVRERKSSPIDLHQGNRTMQGGFLEDYFARARTLLDEASQTISAHQFERICDMLRDERRGIHIIGGRISDALALYLSRHLCQIRGNVHKLSADPESWPEDLLRMKPRDVFFVVDFRRYQPSLLQLAKRASTDRNANVVLLTDKWMSPILRHSTEVVALPIESGTVWDSYAASLVMIEAILTLIAEQDWNKAHQHISGWDALRLDLKEIKNGP